MMYIILDLNNKSKFIDIKKNNKIKIKFFFSPREKDGGFCIVNKVSVCFTYFIVIKSWIYPDNPEEDNLNPYPVLPRLKDIRKASQKRDAVRLHCL